MGDNEQVLVIVTYENGAVSVIDNGRHSPYGYDQRMEVGAVKQKILRVLCYRKFLRLQKIC